MVDRAASETRDPCAIAEEERYNRSQIEDIEHEEADILDSERRLRNRNAYRTSIWDQIIEKQEKERGKRTCRTTTGKSLRDDRIGLGQEGPQTVRERVQDVLSLQSRQRRKQTDR